MTELPTPKPIVFELDRLAEYSDDAIQAELRRVAEIAPDGPLTTRLFQRYSRVSFGTVIQRFGSWDKALMASGLGDRWLGYRGAKVAATKGITDEGIREALVNLASRLGKTELTWRDVTAHLPFGVDTLKTRWGSVKAAFEAAGIPSTHHGRYSDEECFDNMLIVWTHHGRPPRFREMGEPPSKVGVTPYVERFGSWHKALAAFVNRVNSDLDIPAFDTSLIGVSSAIEQFSIPVQEGGRDKRIISLGLRFQVLNRSRFKCMLCGDSPSQNPLCVLHVDHVVPWSKGGRTNIENLRSLCGSCNIGRGNRYDD
jgi:hypothetical protein